MKEERARAGTLARESASVAWALRARQAVQICEGVRVPALAPLVLRRAGRSRRGSVASAGCSIVHTHSERTDVR